MKLPLSRDAILRVSPSPTLSDLVAEPHDIENDFHVLLDFLSPYYELSAVPEPSARVRAAAKRCLKDPAHHGDFVSLLLNTIRCQFHLHFRDVCESASLASVVSHIRSLQEYYSRKSAVLHLSVLAMERLERGISELFCQHLRTPRLLAELETLAKDTLARVGRDDTGSELQNTSPSFASIQPDVIAIFQVLAAVGLAETIQEFVVRHATLQISAYVERHCAGLWTRPCLGPIQDWVHARLAPAVEAVCSAAHTTAELVAMARDELVLLRTGEIFAMTAAYPASVPALSELHVCLVQAPLSHRSRLVESFVLLCERHLLNSASNTVDIVLLYTKMLKAFLVVDPTGVLLDKVARPMRRYLKTRVDLVSQLVRAMLDRDPETNPLVELAEALFAPSQSVQFVDDLSDKDWCPDPIDALPDFRKGKVLDVVQALTSIVQSNSVFVDEFTGLFADRLLQTHRYSSRHVLDYVHHLKARFGANEFATLDVMIRDIDDSANVAGQLSNPNASVPLTVSVLSKMYWPSIESLSENDNFSVPIETEFAAYAERYQQIKAGRSISLIPSLGSVTVELFSQDTAKEYVVTPSQAKVIEVFDDDMDDMSLDTVVMVGGMSSYVTSQALRFWVQEGVLIQENGKFRAAS